MPLTVQFQDFMDSHIYPREHDWYEWCLDQDKLWTTLPWYDELQALPRARVLWNVFLPASISLEARV